MQAFSRLHPDDNQPNNQSLEQLIHQTYQQLNPGFVPSSHQSNGRPTGQLTIQDDSIPSPLIPARSLSGISSFFDDDESTGQSLGQPVTPLLSSINHTLTGESFMTFDLFNQYRSAESPSHSHFSNQSISPANNTQPNLSNNQSNNHPNNQSIVQTSNQYQSTEPVQKPSQSANHPINHQSTDESKIQSNDQVNTQSSDQLTNESTDLSNNQSPDQSSAQERKRRKIACTVCHYAKTSCDGHRPCSRCTRLNKQSICFDRISKSGYNQPVNFSSNQSISQSIHQAISQAAYNANHQASVKPNAPVITQAIKQAVPTQPTRPVAISPAVIQPISQSINPAINSAIKQSINPVSNQVIHPAFSQSLNLNTPFAILTPLSLQQLATSNQSNSQPVNQLLDPSLLQTAPVTFIPISSLYNRPSSQSDNRLNNYSNNQPILQSNNAVAHQAESSPSTPRDEHSNIQSSNPTHTQSNTQTKNQTSHQPNNHSDEQSDARHSSSEDEESQHQSNIPNSGLDDDYDPHKFQLSNPKFHQLFSHIMKQAHSSWSINQSITQSFTNPSTAFHHNLSPLDQPPQPMNRSVHQPLDPMRSVGLLGKLVFLSWLQSIMQPRDLEELLHFTSPLDVTIARVSAIKELAILDRNRSLNQTNPSTNNSSINRSNDQTNQHNTQSLSSNQTNNPTTNQKSNKSSSEFRTLQRGIFYEIMDASEQSNSSSIAQSIMESNNQLSDLSSNHSSNHSNHQTDDQSTNQLKHESAQSNDSNTCQHSRQDDGSHNHSTHHSTSMNNQSTFDQSMNQPIVEQTQSRVVRDHLGQCDGSACRQFCPAVRAWSAANPCIFTYHDSPLKSISQAVNRNVMNSHPVFEYPLFIETIVNSDEINSENTCRQLVLSTLRHSQSVNPSNLPPAPAIRVRFSVSVNQSFERMFGWSASEVRSMSIAHGTKAMYSLLRPDFWSKMMLNEQEATFGRSHEYNMYVVCVNKWRGEVYCMKHTKYVYDENGRYKENVTHFIPLPDTKAPPYQPLDQSNKQSNNQSNKRSNKRTSQRSKYAS